MKKISPYFKISIFTEIIFSIKILPILVFLNKPILEPTKIDLPSEIYFYYNFHLANRKCIPVLFLSKYKDVLNIIEEDLKYYKIHFGLTSLCKTKINDNTYYVVTYYEKNLTQIHVYYFDDEKCEKYFKKEFQKENEIFYKIGCVSHENIPP